MTDYGRAPSGQALAKAEPVSRLGPSGFDPSRRLRIENCAWLHVASDLVSELLPMLPEGTTIIKAMPASYAGVQALLVGHVDIPADADWVTAEFVAERGQAPRFDAWRVIPNTSDTGERPPVLAIATEAGTAETPQSGSVHEGAGLAEASPNPGPSTPSHSGE